MKVEFLYNEKNRDLFAYFPDDTYDGQTNLRACYSRNGQHSACSPEYAKESRPASPDEYEALKSELEGMGYAF